MFEQVLIIIGASIFGVLGFIHLIYTFYTNKFDARKSSVTDAMKTTSPVLTKETTMWDAWVGFNASHSLGAILVAAFFIPLVILDMKLIIEFKWFSILPVIIGFSYLLLAKKYWFKIPFLGILISTICFTVAAVLINT
ncbi:MAG: hypothetical protein KZQ70_00925 [gamma proteobacterium symbiont of Lucinoma myriamae]|nr:hypothetical protein [gamma proteobacterium symbiont of Lucinoma myriamae]MCU7819543.1 hypothetical protein [gamma proteobacterium symbiont of Lucinoma myriamae]